MREDTKKRIIELYYKDQKRIKTIFQKIALNEEITFQEIYDVINEYKEKNPDNAIRKARICSADKISYEELFELCEKGLSYNDIVDYYNKKGIEVTYPTICQRCKDAYSKFGKTKRNLIKDKTINVPEGEMIKLRKQGLSYSKIAKYFTTKGITISSNTIRRKCMRIYKEQGIEQIDCRKVGISAGKKDNKGNTSGYKSKFNDNIDDMIYMLKIVGKSCRGIARCLDKYGVSISYEGVRQRLQVIEGNNKKLEKEDNKAYKNKIKKAILNLKKTRNATDTQLKMLAEIYGVDLTYNNDIDYEK